MSFGTPGKGALFPANAQVVVAGAAKSEWVLANNSLQTVNTNVILNLGHATAYTNILPIEVPVGATRCWIRGNIGTSFTTVTTLPILKPVVTDKATTDGTGISWRIDTDDSDGAGVTLTYEATPASHHFLANDPSGTSKYWTDIVGGTSGYDVRGGRMLYVLVSTAASLVDGGAAQVTAAAYVMFGN